MREGSNDVTELLQFEQQFREVRLNNPVVYEAMSLESQGLSTDNCMKLAIIELSRLVQAKPVGS